MGLDPEGNTMETVLQSAHSTWDRQSIKKGKSNRGKYISEKFVRLKLFNKINVHFNIIFV